MSERESKREQESEPACVNGACVGKQGLDRSNVKEQRRGKNQTTEREKRKDRTKGQKTRHREREASARTRKTQKE